MIDISNDIFAHTKINSDEKQLLSEHLIKVANKVQEFCSNFIPAENGYITGLLHDLGKVSEGFQKRLDGGKIVDHSSAGAVALFENKLLPEAMCVAGHHGGLLDIGNKTSFDDGTFLARIINNKNSVKTLINHYLNNIKYPEFALNSNDIKKTDQKLALCIYTHMLFSCLVDADFLDTESFITGRQREKKSFDSVILERIISKADLFLSSNSKNPIYIERNKILTKCIKMARGPKGLYSLSVPTGAGKTFSSLAFAAEHIKMHPEIKKIIYVIPYISIIEQTSRAIKDIVGDEFVLEHHSLSNDLLSETSSNDNIKYLSSENWDIPIVITTNEQFFESFYSNKPSKCRKLHNVANSVVIFDEAQMIPLPLLELCIKLIERLVNDYGVTAIFCTATQPELDKFLTNPKLKEIVNYNDFNGKIFNRATIKNIDETVTEEEVVDMAIKSKQSLIIVNRKDTANRIYELLPEDSRYILTTNLTPIDRMKQLNNIRKLLKERNKPNCYLVATSLIEAGVDVDFDTVYREKFGLDSIVQAAGRCNREGLKPFENSFTYVFQLDNSKITSAETERKIISLTRAMKQFDLNNPDIIKAYFNNLYNDTETSQCVELVNEIKYKTLGQKFKLISDKTISVIIPSMNIQNILNSDGPTENINYANIKKLALHSVRCRMYQFDKLLSSGNIYYLNGNEEFPVLGNSDLYGEVGLMMPENNGEITW